MSTIEIFLKILKKKNYLDFPEPTRPTTMTKSSSPTRMLMSSSVFWLSSGFHLQIPPNLVRGEEGEEGKGEERKRGTRRDRRERKERRGGIEEEPHR
jgi:hypothetical protein